MPQGGEVAGFSGPLTQEPGAAGGLGYRPPLSPVRDNFEILSEGQIARRAASNQAGERRPRPTEVLGAQNALSFRIPEIVLPRDLT